MGEGESGEGLFVVCEGMGGFFECMCVCVV